MKIGILNKLNSHLARYNCAYKFKLFTREYSGIKPTTSSSNFTFATKYPRQQKPKQRTKPKGNTKKDTHIPARLRLAEIKRTEHSQKFELVSDKDPEWQKQKPEKKQAFTEFKLDPDLLDGIKNGLGFHHASQVQQACINTVLEYPDRNILVGSQTGSGKTLGYLLPIMNELKQQERNSPPSELVEHFNDGKSSSLSFRKLKRPRAIIFLPSRSLVEQVTKVGKLLSHYCRMRVVGITSRTTRVKELLASPIDVLVTTPTCLLSLVKENDLSLSQTKRIVFDEADTLFDESFNKETVKIIDLKTKVEEIRKLMIPMMMVTATFPQTLNNQTKEFDLIRLTTPSLHKTPSNLKQSFLRVGQSTTKNNLLLETLKRAVTDTEKILIFCNRLESVQKVYDFLLSKNYPVLKIDSTQEDIKESFQKFQEPGIKIMVATDIASRGIDLNIGHVIIYEFPHTVIDYMHRAGRTARFGKTGRVTSFLTRKDLRLGEAIMKSTGRLPSKV
ncbi:hypothetical protein HDV06_000630 [Boothiomyces sp. JEL0866]|nr:hypothetical protein HDV06_000630 [Boothiomyces sp. JEL0866]